MHNVTSLYAVNLIRIPSFVVDNLIIFILFKNP